MKFEFSPATNPLRRPPAGLLSFRTVEEPTLLPVPALQHSRFATMKDASQVVELHKQYRRGCSSRAGKETPVNPGPVNFLFPQSSVPTSGFNGSRATILQCLGDSILLNTKRTLSRRAPGPHRSDTRSMRIRAVSSDRDNHRAHPFFAAGFASFLRALSTANRRSRIGDPALAPSRIPSSPTASRRKWYSMVRHSAPYQPLAAHNVSTLPSAERLHASSTSMTFAHLSQAVPPLLSISNDVPT